MSLHFSDFRTQQTTLQIVRYYFAGSQQQLNERFYSICKENENSVSTDLHKWIIFAEILFTTTLLMMNTFLCLNITPPLPLLNTGTALLTW